MPAGGTGPSCPERTHALSYKLCCHIIESCSGRASLALVVPYPTHSQKINSGRRHPPGIYKCGRYHSRGRLSRHLWQTDLGQVPSFPSPLVMWGLFLSPWSLRPPVPNGGHTKMMTLLTQKQALPFPAEPGGQWYSRGCAELQSLWRSKSFKSTRNSQDGQAKQNSWKLFPVELKQKTASSFHCLLRTHWGVPWWPHLKDYRACPLAPHNHHPLLCSWVLPSQTKTDFWVGWAISPLGFQ